MNTTECQFIIIIIFFWQKHTFDTYIVSVFHFNPCIFKSFILVLVVISLMGLDYMANRILMWLIECLCVILVLAFISLVELDDMTNMKLMWLTKCVCVIYK
jgi:hypothetical protein